MRKGAWRVAHFVDAGWKGKIGQVDVCVVLVGANMVSMDRKLEGSLD
jgi:deoxycytidine triphosphate deaminase